MEIAYDSQALRDLNKDKFENKYYSALKVSYQYVYASVKTLTHQNFKNEKHSWAEFKMGWSLNFFYLYFFKELGPWTVKWAWPMEVTIPCHHLNRVNLWLQTFKEICHPLISDSKRHSYIWFYVWLLIIIILCCLDLLHSPHIQQVKDHSSKTTI